jgi:hypothetical protein
MAEEYQKEIAAYGRMEDGLKEQEAKLQELFKEAQKITWIEFLRKNNKEDIQAYVSELSAYVDECKKFYLCKWANDIKKDFCTDEKNDELARLKKHIASFKDKAAEMNRSAVALYKKLAADMGTAAMDVTTVYLPQLTTIADGNGWILDNIFSKLYTTIIGAEHDEAETAVRKELEKFLEDNIYNAVNEAILKEIKGGQYQVVTKKEDPKTKKEVSIDETRYFCNPNLERSNEKIVEDFLSLAITVLEKKMRESKDIQEKWDTKKISAFFADLTNEEKDNVRRSLNPALFFSYNSNRIEVIKKEEHVVFVAGNEDLAVEMLGFQKGNPKHRFEVGDNENTALVLKSKYGLALEDYRVYDSIKMVYDRATFREKYHFHHDFAQFLDKITLDDLPEEVLPQHRTYAKMLMLNKFREETKPFFFFDEYDEEVYTDSMYLPECETSYKIAQPEALSTHPKFGTIILKLNDNGRRLFKEIEGVDFPEQFAAYRDLYYNYRFGETTETILQHILRQSRNVDNEQITGEMIFKKYYTQKHTELLKELSQKKKDAVNNAEKRLYNVLFTIVREELDTVHKFISKR